MSNKKKEKSSFPVRYRKNTAKDTMLTKCPPLLLVPTLKRKLKQAF
jgi:hypothetical protein